MFINGGIPTLYVSNLNRAISFYVNKLGLSLKYKAEEEWAEIDAGNGTVFGLHQKPEDKLREETGRNMTLGFYVDDNPIEETKIELEKRGVNSLGEIHEDGPVKICHFEDPDGNILYLCEQIDEFSQ